jgi:antitoxin (DNA-binding transcriptional repressor) of toxin-antitoxin stability system
MTTVTIEQLDPSTGRWLREASAHDGIIVTDHGRPLLTISSAKAEPARAASVERVLLPEFLTYLNQPVGGLDSAEMIAEGRADRLE